MDDKFQKLTALAVVGLTAACVYIFRSRIGPDLWPLDASRVGPNLVASALTWAVVFVAAVLLWPPSRRRIERWVHRFVDHKLAALHDHHAAHHESLERLHEKLDRLLGDDGKQGTRADE